MPDNQNGTNGHTTREVVICGGGLSGLLLARQIRQEHPEKDVTVLERVTRPLPDACHKVGESSVELGSQYLERLGLRDYLLERHIVKLGLRFMSGGGELPVAERTELGPCAEPVVNSYQLDRGRFEEDLRGFLEEDGVRLVEGAKVTGIDLGAGDADHTIRYELDGTDHQLQSRWVVDATGRSALIRKGHKLTRGARHAASAGWYRIKGKFDINDLVPKSETQWHERPCAAERWRSTNHFMGEGYWVWVIPLSTGNTSIGLVIHTDVHDATNIAGLEAVQAFIEKHEPHLWKELSKWEVKDFLCLHNYSHTVARGWSEDRWALVGEAGAFVDPLYSPGTDFIALANSFTTEMMRAEKEGIDLKERAGTLNAQYRALVSGAIDLFRNAAPVYGHAPAMATKIFWDNLLYWGFTCQYLQQNLHRLPFEDYAPYSEVGRRFLELSGCVQLMLRGWAQRKPAPHDPRFVNVPEFPSLLVDAHTQLTDVMTPEETLEYMQMRLDQGHEIFGEIAVRIVQELGPEQASEVLEESRFWNMGVTIPTERLDAEAKVGLGRRRALSPVARDVERTLGPVRKHEQASTALELLAQGAAK